MGAVPRPSACGKPIGLIKGGVRKKMYSELIGCCLSSAAADRASAATMYVIHSYKV